MKKQQSSTGKIIKIVKSNYIDHKLRKITIEIKENNKNHKTSLTYEYRPFLYKYSKESKKLAIHRHKQITQNKSYQKKMDTYLNNIESKFLIGLPIKLQKTNTQIEIIDNPFESGTGTNIEYKISKKDIISGLKLTVKILVGVLIFIGLLFIFLSL